MIECDIIIQFPFQTMDFETLSLHKYQFFPTNHVRHPFSGPQKGSQGKFDLDVESNCPEDPVGLENTDIVTARTIKYIQVLESMSSNLNTNVCHGRAKIEKYRLIKNHCI